MKSTNNPNEFDAQTETESELPEVHWEVREELNYLDGYREMQREIRSMNDGLNFGDW